MKIRNGNNKLFEYTLYVQTPYGGQDDNYSANKEHGLKTLATIAIEHKKAIWRIVRNADGIIVVSGENDF